MVADGRGVLNGSQHPLGPRAGRWVGRADDPGGSPQGHSYRALMLRQGMPDDCTTLLSLLVV